MRLPAQQYLTLRALGAPAVVVSLATQGVFRGFKDTKTPLYATGVWNLLTKMSSVAKIKIEMEHLNTCNHALIM